MDKRQQDRVEVEITSLGSEGDGVGRSGEMAVFVPGTVPGDLVSATVLESHARFLRADLDQVLRPSALRAVPACPVFGRCGGCSWQHMSYEGQLAWKRRLVVEALVRLGHVTDAEDLVRPTLPSPSPWRYRHKMAVPFAPGRHGKPIAGFYAVRSHAVVPFEECLIQHPALDRTLAAVLQLAAHLRIAVYDPRTRRGNLRHLVARASHGKGEVLACLVTAHPDFPEGPALARSLIREVPEVVGVVHNIQGSPGNAILGADTRPIVGADHLIEELDGLRFAVSAPSFFQVAPAQASRLYRVAVEQAGLVGGESAFDVYAGVGTLSLFLAAGGATVEAIEEVPAAVRDGRHNASLNVQRLGDGRVRFHLGRAESVVPSLVARRLRPEVVVLDPPRKGAAPEVLAAIGSAAPDRVVYVSCNPATLARDIELLGEHGYRPQEVQPVDMFPQTAHVECAALLVRRMS